MHSEVAADLCALWGPCACILYTRTRALCVCVCAPLKVLRCRVHSSKWRTCTYWFHPTTPGIHPPASVRTRTHPACTSRLSADFSHYSERAQRERVFVCLFGLMIAHFLWGRCDVPQSNPFWANRKPVSLFSTVSVLVCCPRNVCRKWVRNENLPVYVAVFCDCIRVTQRQKKNTNLPTDTYGHRIPARDRVCARRRARRRVKREARIIIGWCPVWWQRMLLVMRSSRVLFTSAQRQLNVALVMMLIEGTK